MYFPLYYKKYAKKEGFGVVIKKATKNDSGRVIHITLACGCQGKPRTKLSNTFSKLNTSTKTEYKAKLNANSIESKWFVTSVCIDHNYGLSPSKARYLKYYRNLDSMTKRKLEINDRAEIPLSKNFDSLVVEAGGMRTFHF
jgi:hypothetical protein